MLGSTVSNVLNRTGHPLAGGAIVCSLFDVFLDALGAELVLELGRESNWRLHWKIWTLNSDFDSRNSDGILSGPWVGWLLALFNALLGALAFGIGTGTGP